MIDPARQAEVLRLYFAENLSQRMISARMGIHRQSVAALIHRKQVLLERQNPNRRTSVLTPYYDHIDGFLRADPERSAVNILQKLRDMGYLGGLTVLKDYLRTRRPASEPKAYLSLDFVPGQAAQVDWGDFGDYFDLGRKLWCFVMVLCWSRLLYVEFTLSACLESFLRCHENAFRFFGGIPKELWYDNLATAVVERRQKIIRFNPRFLAYAGHCHFKPVACNPASGNEKGRVEDGVRYVRGNFWPGRTFTDLTDANIQSSSWLDQFANKRTHATTRKIPELHFAEEKASLLPLGHPYDTDEISHPGVSHQFRVRFDSNEYSVPWRLSGRTLTLRADNNTVRLYLNRKRVCAHIRSWEKNKSIVNKKHEEGLLDRKPGAQTSSDIAAVKALGPNGCRYLGFLGAQNRSIRSELGHLMVLVTVYGPQAVEQCIKEALENGIIGSHHLERILERTHAPGRVNPQPLTLADERLNIPPYIPNLQTYDELLLDNEPEKHEEENG
jgi:transposase